MTRHFKQIFGILLIWMGIILIACGTQESNLELRQIGMMIFMIGGYFGLVSLITNLK